MKTNQTQLPALSPPPVESIINTATPTPPPDNRFKIALVMLALFVVVFLLVLETHAKMFVVLLPIIAIGAIIYALWCAMSAIFGKR